MLGSAAVGFMDATPIACRTRECLLGAQERIADMQAALQVC